MIYEFGVANDGRLVMLLTSLRCCKVDDCDDEENKEVERPYLIVKRCRREDFSGVSGRARADDRAAKRIKTIELS